MCDMPSKTCELDVIPTKVFKNVLSAIIKNAIIRLLLNKKGLDLELCNCRPVSNLPFLSKVLEKAVLKQFNEHPKSFS